jgi:rare lipoprotein A
MITLRIALVLIAVTLCAPLWGAPQASLVLDRSGRAKVGIASFYADSFSGRKMADGTRMQPQGNNAASRTLPLGTTAMVTNLETGKRAIVTIRDRGPYVGGRIVDLSPATARKIGITPQKGLAKVEVAPLEVPMRDGTLMAGVSTAEHR